MHKKDKKKEEDKENKKNQRVHLQVNLLNNKYVLMGERDDLIYWQARDGTQDKTNSIIFSTRRKTAFIPQSIPNKPDSATRQGGNKR